ncbi:MAG: ABC transporter permease [Cellulosilyticaceae bacterium]
MSGAVKLGLLQFLLVYVLLIVVIGIMKYSKINQTKLVMIASIRMSIQLVIAGFVLQYIFKNAHPIYTIIFLAAILAFSIHRVLKLKPDLNVKFKLIIVASLSISGIAILLFFVGAVVREDIFNPQYTIPLAGMIIGNSMTGLTLGLKSFSNNLENQKNKINTLINLGVPFKNILKPFVNDALETALMPTLNSMLGMGIIFLPGMMTGQILSGTLPTTAIMYQIAIMIAICTSVCLTVFLALNLGYKTLYNEKNQYLGLETIQIKTKKNK